MKRKSNVSMTIVVVIAVIILQLTPAFTSIAASIWSNKEELAQTEIQEKESNSSDEENKIQSEYITKEDGKIQYLVKGESENAYNKIKELCQEDCVKELEESYKVLQEENMLIADLTKEEAKILAKQKDVMLEKDFLLSASDSDVEITLSSKEEKEAAALHQVVEDKWDIKAVQCNEEDIVGKEFIKVAVLDSGFDKTSDKSFVECVNLIPSEIDSHGEDMTGHGTAVSGIIQSGHYGRGTSGITVSGSMIEMYSVRVLDGDNQAPVSRIAEGIQWCIDHKINVINMSFGMKQYSDILATIVKKAEEAGILMIASVGNSGETDEGTVEYPAAYKEVIGVGSVNEKLECSSFSAKGEGVELVAPGENVPVNCFWGFVNLESGTSYAAPHVTAIAALLWSKNANQSAEFIRKLLQCSANRVKNEKEGYGYGLVDYRYALEIYEDFMKNYQTNSVEVMKENFKNEDKVDVYSVPEIVKASWNTAKHSAIVGKAVNETGDYPILIPANDLKRIKSASAAPDYSFQVNGEQIDLNNYDKLHARPGTNYVICARQLVRVALGEKQASECSVDVQKACKVARNLSLDIANGKVIGTSAQLTDEEKNIQILGMALHVLGDAFAHETVVPIYLFDSNLSGYAEEHKTIIKNAKNDINDLISTNDIKPSIRDAIRYTCIATASIARDYRKNNVVLSFIHANTADKVNFLSERYDTGTFYGVSRLLDIYYHNRNSFYVIYAFGTETAHHYGWTSYAYPYKLKGLEANINAMGYTFSDLPWLSLDEWYNLTC